MWYDEAVFYHIYPLGFCGAPKENDGITINRISKVEEWIEHIKKMNISAVYFSPVFESDRHGYDTRDFKRIDCRLGSNDDFKSCCDVLHKNCIKVVLDGVFNHVGRGFWAFQDVLKNREGSIYKDWFHLDFGRDSNYGDGLWYEGWEGHYELVKLRLENPQVREHLYSAIRGWVEEFGIDGLRLDVAYCLPEYFLKELRTVCKDISRDFFLLGEMIHGDYNRIVNPDMLDSATNYECFKGLFSSFVSRNFFEISYSLNRQFGPEDWTLYKGKNLASFADNHDVTRIYSNLEDKQNIYGLYAVLFSMPGIPFIYYGSEWGAEGKKEQGDDALRPSFESPVENQLFEFVARLGKLRRDNSVLSYGDFKNVVVQNKYWMFSRSFSGNTIYTAVNADGQAVNFDVALSGRAVDLLGDSTTEISGSIALKPYEVKIFTMEQ